MDFMGFLIVKEEKILQDIEEVCVILKCKNGR